MSSESPKYQSDFMLIGSRLRKVATDGPWRALEYAREAGALGEPEADARRVHDAAIPAD